MAFEPIELVGGIAIGTGVGQAIGDVVTPKLQDFANEQWAKYPHKPPGVGTLALGVAQGQVDERQARQWAKANGYDDAQFTALINIANVGPGGAYAFELWRRDKIGEAGFRRALKRLGIEQEWIDDLVEIKHILLSPAEVANAVQQGHLPNPGILPDVSPAIAPAFGYEQPPAPDGKPPSHVPLTQIDLDPLVQWAGSGVDEPVGKVLANLAGLPPGPEALLQMWNRSLVDEDSVDAGIREGHMKTKWAQAFKRMRWHVLSAPEYAGLWLRGWITKQQAITGGALTGATPEQMDLLYKNRGRPMAPVQAFTAWARKAPHPVGEGIPARPGTFDFEDFKRAIQQSDIRTEYVEPLWHIRYAYPSLFQLNRLVLAHAITPTVGADWAEKQRYAPEVIAALLKFWEQSAPAVADSHVPKAETQLWTTTHRSYIATESGDAEARERFGLLNISGAAQTRILQLWASERALIRAQLSPSDLRKAFQQADVNAATGAVWTKDEALAALLDRGWSMTDAESYLNIPYKG